MEDGGSLGGVVGVCEFEREVALKSGHFEGSLCSAHCCFSTVD